MINYELEEWTNVLCGRQKQPFDYYIVNSFPTDLLRDEYLSVASTRDEAEVRSILRRFLGESRSHPYLDKIHAHVLKNAAQEYKSEGKDGAQRQFNEYDRRVILNVSGASSVPTLEGLTWVLDLLPHWPQAALQGISAYTLAQAQILSDQALAALADASDLIRAYYITRGAEDVEMLVRLILSLPSRDLEYLTAVLYRNMGFEVEVTKAQKDHGKDVIVSRPGETIFVECKNWEGKVDVTVVAGLVGRVEMAKATRGIIVGISGFTTGYASATEVATDYAARISLVDGVEFVTKLNENLGIKWHLRLERLLATERDAQLTPNT